MIFIKFMILNDMENGHSRLVNKQKYTMIILIKFYFTSLFINKLNMTYNKLHEISEKIYEMIHYIIRNLI